MSLDLTGIENINEFYTDHYLATYFEESVKSAVRVWKEAHEADGAPVPWRELKSTAGRFYQVHERASRATQSERAEARSEMVTLYLKALGYVEPAWVDVDTRSGLDYPAFAEYADASGRPLVQVFLSAQQSPDDDMMEVGLTVPAESEYGNHVDEPAEDVIDGLFFDTTEPARFIILADAFTVMLFDRNKWQEKRCIRFDMEELFRRREDTTFQAMSALLSATSLAPETGASLLDDLDAESRKNAASVSESLKYALRECIELLGNEVIYDWTHNKGGTIDDPEMDEGELTIECLRYMYRMLFLLFMEARPELGFAPMKSEAYLKSYSLESLREIAEALREDMDTVNSETNYIDQTMEMICKLVYDGYPYDDETFKALAENVSVHDAFLVPPLKAHIFDAERTHLISNARLRDCVMVKLIDRMSITETRSGHRRERISYGTLGINQLGSVYEALLSYRGFIARQDLYEVKKRGDSFDPLDVGYFVPESALGDYDEDERVRYESGPHAGELRIYRKGEFVYRLAGREREKSASFYTPESLTHCLVKYALKELLEGKTADEILNLTICEPAMGSAAFLNEAINQLAEAYLAKRQEETGNEIPYDERALELQRVKMYIADRNVYGIDLNPIAVELGEVSLWLNTISQDGHVPWFGNQLHNGNSLIGARRRAYTERQLKSRTTGIRWYDNEPERVGYETGCSKSHRIYHFLVGDPGMSSYKDRVIKELEPEAIRKITTWNRDFIKPYDDGEIRSLRKLSYTIDELWMQQIKQQRQLKWETQDRLAVYGADNDVVNSHTTIREKDAVLSEYYRSEHARNAGPYARLKFAMDYWCALWFWPIDKADLLPTRDEFLLDMAFILEGVVNTAVGLSRDATIQPHLDLGDEYLTDAQLKLQQLQLSFDELGMVDLDDLCEKNRRLAVAREVANRSHFFHWELEFADVFEARGGFDLIIGNPPWVKLEWNEKSLLSEYDPLIVIKRIDAASLTQRRRRYFGQEDIANAYLAEYSDITGQQCFLSSKANYPLLSGSSVNLYSCFIPKGWDYGAPDGVSGFIHQDNVFGDADKAAIRKKLYKRLRKHFHFVNQRHLFQIGNTRTFSLNVYSKEREPSFEAIFDIYDPLTIEECYSDTTGRIIGIKNKRGEWNLEGSSSRIIHIGPSELSTLSKVFGDEASSTRMLNVHDSSQMNVLECFNGSALKTIGEVDDICHAGLWSEPTGLQNGVFEKRPMFPSSPEQLIYSPAMIWVGNPLFQCAKRVCDTHRAYDQVFLDILPDNYLPRGKYVTSMETYAYKEEFPISEYGRSYYDSFRVVVRRRLDHEGARSLISAIIPPHAGHIDTIYGLAMEEKNIAIIGGLLLSLPYDFIVRIMKKGDARFDTLSKLPLCRDAKIAKLIACRALRLNCISAFYKDLWATAFDEDFALDSWAKEDSRLERESFCSLTPEWNSSHSIRSDYARRQALVEIDVLSAMSVGMTLEQLIAIYRVQYAVLQQYEADTWYDSNGTIAFTVDRGLPSVGVARATWENSMLGSSAGTIFNHAIDASAFLPGGDMVNIEYVAPFDKCDRTEDYRTAWAFFESKYGKQGGDE